MTDLVAETSKTVHINIAKQFSEQPFARWPEHSPDSGERFRHQFLIPALASAESVEVEMKGALGYGSSFLEEAFGGLVRFGYFDKPELKKKLIVKHPLKSNVQRVWDYIDTATFKQDSGRRPELDARYAATSIVASRSAP